MAGADTPSPVLVLFPSGSWLGDCLWLAGANGLTDMGWRNTSTLCHRVGDTCTSPLRFQVSRKQAREEEIPFQSLDQGSEMDDGGGSHPWFQWLPSTSPQICWHSFLKRDIWRKSTMTKEENKYSLLVFGFLNIYFNFNLFKAFLVKIVCSNR